MPHSGREDGAHAHYSSRRKGNDDGGGGGDNSRWNRERERQLAVTIRRGIGPEVASSYSLFIDTNLI